MKKKQLNIFSSRGRTFSRIWRLLIISYCIILFSLQLTTIWDHLTSHRVTLINFKKNSCVFAVSAQAFQSKDDRSNESSKLVPRENDIDTNALIDKRRKRMEEAEKLRKIHGVQSNTNVLLDVNVSSKKGNISSNGSNNPKKENYQQTKSFDGKVEKVEVNAAHVGTEENLVISASIQEEIERVQAALNDHLNNYNPESATLNEEKINEEENGVDHSDESLRTQQKEHVELRSTPDLLEKMHSLESKIQLSRGRDKQEYQDYNEKELEDIESQELFKQEELARKRQQFQLEQEAKIELERIELESKKREEELRNPEKQMEILKKMTAEAMDNPYTNTEDYENQFQANYIINNPGIEKYPGNGGNSTMDVLQVERSNEGLDVKDMEQDFERTRNARRQKDRLEAIQKLRYSDPYVENDSILNILALDTDLGLEKVQGFGASSSYAGIGQNENTPKPGLINLQKIIREANNGNKDSMYFLALMRFYGHGVSQDELKAVELFRMAAQKGSLDAMVALGTCLYEGIPGKIGIDLKGAFGLYKEAAEEGNVNAMWLLARLYYEGKGFELDQFDDAPASDYNGFPQYDDFDQDQERKPNRYELAFYWFDKCISISNNKFAHYYLGILYEYGLGIPPDTIKRYNQNYRSATGERISPHKKQNKIVGKQQENEDFINYQAIQNFKQARYHYLQSSSQGHLDASYNLGLMWAYGRGGPQDFNRAFLLFQKAADHLHAPSLYYLGVMTLYGQGVPIDYRAALDFFERCAGLEDIRVYEKALRAKEELSFTLNRAIEVNRKISSFYGVDTG